ncbi:aldehyde dehydrogenase family protein [Chimaeribacter californicus]|uniref:aldehyde dehydrogenase family protein n=1 Tax=Chimaeribacter californicus TaxID=2060067 RepID=UPI0013FD010F|nr:aldehyde dehydrogenase family protein [Chimaeribacter californicus]
MSDVALLQGVRAALAHPQGHYIDGQAVTGNGDAFPVINPATGQTLAEVRAADGAQADAAMEAASAALAGWQAMPTLARGTLLLKLADALAAHREELAQLESLCSGKTLMLARMLEIEQSVAFLRYFAGWAGKISGETLDVSLPSFNGEKYTAFTRRQPVGVVVGIIPWNFSIMIAIWKLAAALVCGCTVVLKPSEFTPLTLLRVAELATGCGIPPGVINVVNGDGKTLGPRLIAHPHCAKVSFTGSVVTGQAVSQAAMAGGKRVTLELGGKNAALFLEDMEVDAIVNGIIEAGYLNQGQICAAAECFYLPVGKMDPVLAALRQRLEAMRIGSPLDEGTEMGPVANRPQYEKLLNLFAQARQEGSEIICGGYALDRDGYYIAPTAIRVTDPQATLMREETFGPVGTFIAYENDADALALINASPSGLAASVWTHDMAKALRYSEQLEAGMVWINMHTFLDPAVPFGGMKDSGIGREFGSAFIEDYTNLKSVMVRY